MKIFCGDHDLLQSENWHAAYLGVRIGEVDLILRGKLDPSRIQGQYARQTGESPPSTIVRQNAWSHKEEFFSLKQIFTSPSVKYAG